MRESLPTGRIVVHLINYSGGMTRAIEKLIPIRHMALKINRPCSSARALSCGRDLDVGADGMVDIPEVDRYEVILIE